MEIHKIEICNLNSLKGEFCIDFMSGNLKGQDIFAITGSTGSGKSTILDAITLALYNRVPRIDGKKGDNSPKDKDPYKRLKPGDTENTLSRGEKKGYAKVVFEVGGQLYRAEWLCELKNLNFGGTHSLYRLKNEAGVEKVEMMVSGNLVHEFDASGFPKDKTVSKMVVELIGLGYDQFCKACILAQNSFSNFLKANDFEKADILEKITGTSIYGRIADVITKGYEKAGSEKKAIDDTISGQQKLKLSEEELSELKTKENDLHKEQDRLNQEIGSLSTGIAWWDDLKTLNDKLGKAEKDKREAEEKEQEFLPSRKRLERHDIVENGLALLGEETRAQTAFKTAEDNVAEAKKKLMENQDDIKTKEEEKDKAGLHLVKKQAELNRLASIKPIKDNISLIRSEYGRLNQSVAELRKAASDYAPESGFDKLGKKILIEAVGRLTGGLNPGITYETENRRLITIQNELAVCKDAGTLYPLLEQIQEIEAKDNADNESVISLTPLFQQLENDVQELKDRINNLENKDLVYKRSLLEEGKPCELCGAIHHPYAAASAFNLEIDSLKAQLEEKKIKKDDVDGKVSDARKDINYRNGQKTTLNSRIKNLQNQIVIQDDTFRTVFEMYAPDKQIQELKAKASQLEKWKEKRNAANKALSLIGLRDTLDKVFSHLNTLDSYLPAGWHDRWAESEVKYSQVFEGDVKYYGDLERWIDICSQSIGRIEASIKTLKDQTLGLEDDIRKKESARDEKKEPLKKATSRLDVWIETFNAENEDPVSREELAAQKEDKTDWVSLRRTVNDAENNRIKMVTLFDQAVADLTKHQEKEDRPAEAKETLEVRKAAFTSQLEEGPDSIVERLKIVSGRLATHDAAEKAIAGVKDDLEKAEKKVNLWTRFYNMLGKKAGDKDAKEFRKLAQNYTLGLLLSYANEELGKFTKRYSLKKQNDNSLEIMVLDGELGERYSSSLSGGETFMVSLALALGLSSISSGSVTLKNIFIDEGFGTLDSDTQKTVVAALNTLRTQGKRIGLISHTAALLSDDSIYKITVKKGDKFSVIDFG